MNRDVYERALRSAAQITFLGFLGGCGGVAAPEEATGATDDALATCGGADGACRRAIADAWPAGDPEWWGTGTPRVQTPVSDRALATCCARLLPRRTDGGGIEYHERLGTWRTSGCCSATRTASDPASPGIPSDPELAVACTPWGPPMPRAARRPAVEGRA